MAGKEVAFDFERLKRSLKGLDDVLREIAKMSVADRTKLFTDSENYLKGKMQDHQTVIEQEKTRREKIELEAKQWNDKVLVDRTDAEHRFSLEMEQLKRDASVHLETTRTQEEKKRVDYRILKEIEMQAEKTRRKLEATKQFEAIDSSLLSKEKDLLDLKTRLEAQRADTELAHQKQLLSYRLEEEAKVEVKMSDFRLKQAIKERDAFRKDIEQEQRMMEEIRQKTEIEKNRIKWEMISSFFDGDAGRSRAFNLFGLFAGTIVSYYGFKTASPVAAQWISNRLFRPRLLSKCVTKSLFSRLLPSSSPFSSSSKAPRVVMGKDLEERMRRITEGTKNTNKHHGLFGHVLLYGLPGTGKSMFAERLAYESDMSFALMSGSAFDQFEPGQAISEIKNLFLWANRQPNGVLLFVDECDSFLEDRKTLSPERVRVLNEFINQTGTETRKFMLCFETNRPEVLDPAVQSRITQSVEFLPPLYPEILLMLRQYLSLYLFSSPPSRWKGLRRGGGVKRGVGEEEEERIAKEMERHRFVGRDVTNYVIAVSQAAFSSPSLEVDEHLMRRVLDEQVQKKQREAQYQEHRSLRILDHRQRLLALHNL